MTDLSQLKSNILDSASVDILHPVTGDEICKITVASPDSAHYKQAIYALQIENMKRNVENADESSAAYERRINLIVSMTLGWEGLQDNGKPFEFTKDNAKRLYSEFSFIAESVENFMVDRKNFYKV